MGGEAGTRSGTGSGFYRTGHGYQSHKIMFNSTVPAIVNSVYVIGYVVNAANFDKVTDALARNLPGLYCKGGKMIARLIEIGDLPNNKTPDEPSEFLKVKDENGNPIENTQFKLDTIMFPMKLKTWYNTLVELDEANNKIYYMFRVQCSLAMITKIEGSKGFKAAQENLEVIRLLALIHAIMCGVEQHVHPTMAIMLMYKNIFCLWQKPS